MSWARFDDRYEGHRKVKRAWKGHPRAVGLHAMAVTYCCHYETDGLVDPEWLEEKLPRSAERRKVLEVLVACRLFEEDPECAGHFRVHDFLEYNPSAAESEERRRRDADRKARGRRPESERSPRGHLELVQSESERPDPTRPDPTPLPPSPPKGGRARDREGFEGELEAWAAEHVPGAPVGFVRYIVGELRACNREATPDAVRAELQRRYPEAKPW